MISGCPVLAFRRSMLSQRQGQVKLSPRRREVRFSVVLATADAATGEETGEGLEDMVPFDAAAFIEGLTS